ncbi:hypothetical protein MTR62_18265, partial [Novosphingobium sp. 1949]|nr:hypothetical protein [Novosphingobium organovorum]
MTAATETARAMPDLLLGTGLALSALGPALLRLGWQARRVPVTLGWAALGLAAALTTVRAGAWGLATGCVIASACALAL